MTHIIAHRGGALQWLENSRLACRKAVLLGADEVQLDVHATRDGGVVVIHDATLERTTDAAGPVGDMASEQLRGVRLRDGGGEGLPMLEEIIDILLPSRAMLRLELKRDATGRPYPALQQNLRDVLRRTGILDRTIVSSFVRDDVVVAMRNIPARSHVWLIGMAYLAERTPHQALAEARSCSVRGIGLRWNAAPDRFASDLAESGLNLDLFGCNDEVALAAALRASPAGVMTDRPELAMRMRDARKAGEDAIRESGEVAR